MMRRAAITLAGAIAVFGAGCAQRPVVTPAIVDVSLAEATEDAAVLRFTLEAGARGAEALSLKEVRYTVTLDGETVFEGTRYAEATVSAERPQRIALPAPVRADQTAWPLAGDRRYRISGTVAFLRPGPIGQMLYDLGLKRRRVRFSERGTLRVGPAAAPNDQSTDSASTSDSSASGSS